MLPTRRIGGLAAVSSGLFGEPSRRPPQLPRGFKKKTSHKWVLGSAVPTKASSCCCCCCCCCCCSVSAGGRSPASLACLPLCHQHQNQNLRAVHIIINTHKQMNTQGSHVFSPLQVQGMACYIYQTTRSCCGLYDAMIPRSPPIAPPIIFFKAQGTRQAPGDVGQTAMDGV